MAKKDTRDRREYNKKFRELHGDVLRARRRAGDPSVVVQRNQRGLPPTRTSGTFEGETTVSDYDETDFAKSVDEVLGNIRTMVISKNKNKLSRLSRGSVFENEDTVADLIGYLVLLRVSMRLELAS
jgi:hypothetical protein